MEWWQVTNYGYQIEANSKIKKVIYRKTRSITGLSKLVEAMFPPLCGGLLMAIKAPRGGVFLPSKNACSVDLRGLGVCVGQRGFLAPWKGALGGFDTWKRGLSEAA